MTPFKLPGINQTPVEHVTSAATSAEMARAGMLGRRAEVLEGIESLRRTRHMNSVTVPVAGVMHEQVRIDTGLTAKNIENRPQTHFSAAPLVAVETQSSAVAQPTLEAPAVTEAAPALTPVQAAQQAVAEAFTKNDVELVG